MKPVSPDKLKRMAQAAGARLDIDTPTPDLKHPEPDAAPPGTLTPAHPAAPAVLTLAPEVAGDFKEAVMDLAKHFEASLIDHARAHERISEVLANAMTSGVSATQAERKPTGWVFTVKRDLRGLIETIEAKAKQV